MFYVLVMNTVKLCIREKNEKQMLPFSDVVYHMPLSELKGVTLCEQETQPTIILSSLHFTPSFTRRYSVSDNQPLSELHPEDRKDQKTRVTCCTKLSARH